MIGKIKTIKTVISLLLLTAMPLHAQYVMEVSYHHATTPASVFPLEDIGKMWFADDMLQASSVTSPAQITKLELAGIRSIKFKSTQTNVQQLNAEDSESCTVYDLQGRIVSSGSWSSINGQRSLPPGIYIIRSNSKTVKIRK